MASVTAKELRQNLSEYLDRLEAGEEVTIIRHSRPIGTLSPREREGEPNGEQVAQAMRDFLKDHEGHKHLVDTSKPYKEVYHEHLAEKYGKYTTD